jgi:hypothetical protein
MSLTTLYSFVRASNPSPVVDLDASLVESGSRVAIEVNQSMQWNYGTKRPMFS